MARHCAAAYETAGAVTFNCRGGGKERVQKAANNHCKTVKTVSGVAGSWGLGGGLFSEMWLRTAQLRVVIRYVFRIMAVSFFFYYFLNFFQRGLIKCRSMKHQISIVVSSSLFHPCSPFTCFTVHFHGLPVSSSFMAFTVIHRVQPECGYISATNQ